MFVFRVIFSATASRVRFLGWGLVIFLVFASLFSACDKKAPVSKESAPLGAVYDPEGFTAVDPGLTKNRPLFPEIFRGKGGVPGMVWADYDTKKMASIRLARFEGGKWVPFGSPKFIGRGLVISGALQSKTGGVHVVYIRRTQVKSETGRELYVITFNGNVWGKSEKLSIGKSKVYKPIFLEDKKGGLHLVYQGSQGHNGGIVYQYQSKGKWERPRQISKREAYAAYWMPEAVMGADNTLHLVYARTNNKGSQVLYSQKPAGGRFSEAVEVSTGLTHGFSPSLALKDGKPWVSFVAGKKNELLFLARQKGGGWEREKVYSGQTGIQGNSLNFNPNGRPFFFWLAQVKLGSPYELFFTSQEAGQWGEPTNLTKNKSNANSLSILATPTELQTVWIEMKTRSQPVLRWAQINLKSQK